MSFLGLDSLFGKGSNKTNQNQVTDSNSTRNATQTSNTTSKSSTDTSQSQTGRTTQLDPETLGAITSVVKALAGDINPNLDINSIIDAQRKEAVRQFNEQDMAQINQLAQQTGSIDNSAVQELVQKGQADLQTRLAALGANTQLQARYNAADALSRAGVVAKGSDTTSQINTTGQSDTQQTVDAISKLVEELTSHTNTDTSSKTGGNNSLLGSVTNLLGAL